MKPRFLALLLLINLFSSYSFALDYEITSVIEVGEADFHPYLSPVIWSPDGTMLAFTKDGVIKISDTLGNVRDIIKLDMPIHNWAWVSDKEIAVHMRRFTGNGPETVEELSLINILANSKSVVHKFKMERNYREIPNKTISHGPYETVEGNKYYIQTTYQGKGKKPVNKQLSFISNNSEDIKNDRFLRWSDSGLYMVRIDETDSTWLAEKPFQQMSPRPIINSDLSFAVDDNQLFNLVDSTRISLGFHFGSLPLNTVVRGAIWSSFNSEAAELLLTISCDDGHHYVTRRIATFDCLTLELNIIDSLIEKSECAAAVFSPNGNKISFLTNNKVHLLTRRFK